MKTKATNFNICCRRLVGALRQPPTAGGHASFFLGFDADGLPFYRAGSFHAGPLFFCPFCGRRVREGGDPVAAARRAALCAARAAAEDGDEELTRPALAEADEPETVIAPRRAQEAAARPVHFTDLGSAGRAKSESGTGALNSTFS